MHWLQSTESAPLIVINVFQQSIHTAGRGSSLKLQINAKKTSICQTHSKEFTPTSEQKKRPICMQTLCFNTVFQRELRSGKAPLPTLSMYWRAMGTCL